MDKEPKILLTPAQAADVLRYRLAVENQHAREHGYGDKVPLGIVAIHAMRMTVESPEGEQQSLLTGPEMLSGMEYLKLEEERHRNYLNNLATPPRTNADRDHAERAAGEKLNGD